MRIYEHRGELAFALLVSFQKPHLPDLKAVAELQKQKYLPSLNNPAAAVCNIFDAPGVVKD
jgi:hypothetical protein